MSRKERQKFRSDTFNKIRAENFPSLRKELSVWVQKPHRWDKKTPCQITVKTLSIQNKESLLKATVEKP